MKQLGLQVVKMTKPGLMDGGDVLFTGREFFVGLSTRTNKVSAVSTHTIRMAVTAYNIESVFKIAAYNNTINVIMLAS